jgi:hypothetical protein
MTENITAPHQPIWILIVNHCRKPIGGSISAENEGGEVPIGAKTVQKHVEKRGEEYYW